MTAPATIQSSDRVPRWVVLADVLTVALVVVSVAVLFTGGGRVSFQGVRLSLTSWTRIFLLAVIVAAIRHAAFRRPTLVARLRGARAYPPVARLLALLERAAPLARDDCAFVSMEQASPTRETAALPCPPRVVRATEILLVASAMAVLTAVATYPQVARLDRVRDLGDPVFSTWRLAWLAHQLPRDPVHLFDANIFYPERWTLAYSDPMLLVGIAGAPFIWLGIAPVVVHNLLTLASFVLAGVCMYLFMQALTGSRPAAAVAAVAFAFYPFRFDQYAHFEQLFSFWMPLSLWALHRAVAGGRKRDGLLLGALVAGQYLSGMYQGIFLAAYLAPLGLGLALGSNRVRESARPLAAGAVLAAFIIAPTLFPYMAVRQTLGERPHEEVFSYSRPATNYLVANGGNALYGRSLGAGAHAPEGDFFPGVLVVVLSLIAVWPPLSLTRLSYLLALLFAFDASLGMHGVVYPILYKWLLPFRGLRVPGRFSMLVGVSLSVLAAYGAARIGSRFRRQWVSCAFAAFACAGILIEARPVLDLQPLWPLHPVYHYFDGRPTGVIAELPVPGNLPPQETRYMHFSTFHWQHLLNGYSGAFPSSWALFSGLMASFPDDRSIAFLKSRSARVVVHEAFFGKEAYNRVVSAAGRRADLREVARAGGPGDEARIYEVAR